MSFGQHGGYGSRGGFGRSFVSFKKPVEVGKEYTVTISDVSRKGDGLARVEGFVVFIPATVRGQIVKIRVTRVSDRYAIGQTIEAPTAATATATSEFTRTDAEQQ